MLCKTSSIPSTRRGGPCKNCPAQGVAAQPILSLSACVSKQVCTQAYKNKKDVEIRHLLASFVFVGAEGFEAKLARMTIRATPDIKCECVRRAKKQSRGRRPICLGAMAWACTQTNSYKTKTDDLSKSSALLQIFVGAEGFEPPTLCL